MLKRILHIHSYFKVCAREAQHDCCFASMWFQFVVIAVPGSKLAIGHIFFPQIFFFFYGYWITDYSLPVTWCPLRGLFLQCLCCSYYYHYIKMIIVLLLLNYFCCCCCNIQGMTKVLIIIIADYNYSHDLSGWNAFITLKFWLLPFEEPRK